MSKHRLGLEGDQPSGRQEQDPAGLGAAHSVRVPAADTDMAERRAPNVPCLVFQCRFAKDLFCAVPKSRSIPDFLIGPGWRFWGSSNKKGRRALGFNRTRALADIRKDGHHFFVGPRCRPQA